MHIDGMNIKSITFVQCGKLIRCLANGGHAETIDNLVAEACEKVLEAASAKRELRLTNVPSTTDLLTDDATCMVPNKKGFWTPAND